MDGHALNPTDATIETGPVHAGAYRGLTGQLSNSSSIHVVVVKQSQGRGRRRSSARKSNGGGVEAGAARMLGRVRMM